MKKRFLANIFILSLVTPILNGCFSYTPSSEEEEKDEPAPSIRIQEDELLVKHTSGETNYWYNLDLAMGSSYHLNADLGDYSGTQYSLAYEFSIDETYKDVCVIDTSNNITTKSNAEVGDRANLRVRLMKKGKSYPVETKNIFITVGDQYANVKAILTSKSSDVVVSSGGYNYDFKLSIPMSGKFYPMPVIEIINFEDYTLSFTPKYEDSVIFNADDSDIYFMINIDVDGTGGYHYSTKYFDINLLDKNGDFVKKFTCLLNLTYDDPDVLQIYYGSKRSQLRDNDVILIEKSTDKTPIVSYYDGYEINALNSVLKVEIEDQSIVSASHGTTEFGYTRYLRTGSVGETSVAFIYDKDGSKERIIHTTAIIYDGKELKDIYVPFDIDAFSIDGDKVNVTGKIYAVYEVGEPEAINGHEDLNINLENTSDPNVKKVTLSFTYKGINKTKEFNVPLHKTNAKTEITQNYKSYWAINNHASTPLSGDVKVLAIPIWFTDSNEFINEEKGHKEQVIDDLTLGLFGSNDDISFRSLRTYYLEESLGKLRLSGTVTPWYECGKQSTYYEDKDTKITDLVANAIKWYFDESGTSETRSDYDSNNDGKIDHVIAYYGANYHCFRNNYAVASGWCRRLTTNSIESTLSNFSWVSAMNMYGLSGLSPKAYNQLNVDDLSTIHGIDVKTTIHEFAHGLGITDIYDTTMKSTPVGAFTMQSSNKGGHDPYNLMAMNFANPYVFDSSDSSLDNEITFTIHDSQSSGDMILLTPHWDNEKQIFDEYMLLDLYTPTGLNAYHAKSTKGANCVGVRLWHVNAQIDPSTHKHKYSNSSDVNYDLIHYIRNDENETYRTLGGFGEDNIFKQGDSFTMDAYKSQFYNADGKLDSGLSLGWSFEIVSINVDEYGSATATIKLTKTSL